MFTAGDLLPREETARRLERFRGLLRDLCPEAGGALVFSRATTYYFTGTLANGVCWIPAEGPVLLLARKGLERARLESPGLSTAGFSSYNDLSRLAEEHGAPLPPVVAAEQGALPWKLASMLTQRLPHQRFVSADAALARCRAVKSSWELEKMRLAGARHHRALTTLLPACVRPGMTERDISHRIWNVFFSLGHAGHMRMANFGEEMFLGHVAAGENGNYPSHFNGPLGVMGEHPAAPYMGNAGVIWKKNALLAVDAGFCLEGYNTDKTQLYFSGPEDSLPDPARRAHDACLEIEAAVTAAMAPGAVPSQLYARALDMAARAGFAEGFMGLGGNHVAFLGHGIGLAVDEWPVLARRFDLPLEEGMTIAVEPKIGLPGIGMVGSENTYEITSAGCACLTGGPGKMIFVD